MRAFERVNQSRSGGKRRAPLAAARPSCIVRGVLSSRWLFVATFAAAVLGACGGAPLPADSAESPSEQPVASAPARAAAVPDDCAVLPGKPPPKPLEREYTGVAAKARCQREVYTIMGGVTHFLGVKCNFCHVLPDYRVMTHRKHVANWMARELIPHLSKKTASPSGNRDLWCNDCHLVNGKGTTKILGNPRDQKWAIEWMTTHLVEDFETAKGNALYCKSCHKGNVGSPEFQRKIILTGNLPAD
jgi:hypothetical protein